LQSLHFQNYTTAWYNFPSNICTKIFFFFGDGLSLCYFLFNRANQPRWLKSEKHRAFFGTFSSRDKGRRRRKPMETDGRWPSVGRSKRKSGLAGESRVFGPPGYYDGLGSVVRGRGWSHPSRCQGSQVPLRRPRDASSRP